MAKMADGFVPNLFSVHNRKPVSVFDGMCLLIQNKWKTPERQRADFNDWKSQAQRKLLLMFDFDGKVVMAVWNITGRLHDSDAAWFGGFYDAIERLLDECCVVADLAFVGGVRDDDRVLRVLKSSELVPAEISNAELVDLEKDLTKLRQSTEWANNGLKQVCKRLDCKLSFDDAKNKEMLELCILLHNWRNSTCDRQQLKTFFRSLVQDQEQAE
jgi:hypothetical protein